MEDPRLKLLDAFDPLKDADGQDTDGPSKLKVKTSGFKDAIFLCGGKLTQNGEPAGSLRDRIHRFLKTNSHKLVDRIVLAETFIDRFGVSSNTGYKDLISFEKDLANLAGLIVLVVESPGALAELGAFCQLQPLADRLHVVLNQVYSDNRSFIMMGPVQHLETHYKNPPFVYDWPRDSAQTDKIANETLNDIVDDIADRFGKLPQTETFKGDNQGHRMLLICDLLHCFIALKESELLEYLSRLLPGPPLTELQLSQMLFVLQCRKLVERKRYKNYVCYVSCKGASPITGHSVASNLPDHDMTSLKWKLVKPFYETKSERWRLKVATKLDRERG